MPEFKLKLEVLCTFAVFVVMMYFEATVANFECHCSVFTPASYEFESTVSCVNART